MKSLLHCPILLKKRVVDRAAEVINVSTISKTDRTIEDDPIPIPPPRTADVAGTTRRRRATTNHPIPLIPPDPTIRTDDLGIVAGRIGTVIDVCGRVRGCRVVDQRREIRRIGMVKIRSVRLEGRGLESIVRKRVMVVVGIIRGVVGRHQEIRIMVTMDGVMIMVRAVGTWM